MKPILITPTAVPALVAAITALTGTPHESALVDLLREASPWHPLLWDLARLQRDHDEVPVERREVTAEMVREHACKAIVREQGAL